MMMYKNYPLVRKGNEMYFGYMSEPYVVYLKVENSQKQQDIIVSKSIKFYQMSTDFNHPQPVQKAERDSLYEALDVAIAWLNRANKA
ncbi:MAG: hypothetical protein IKI37_09655 [Oscillospiraceae bacterium]|nr:hypothetical protein [Oscillospiraceae bacterium]MBR7085419.1 hypothetical protein [Oscillospiraceae bacterium]